MQREALSILRTNALVTRLQGLWAAEASARAQLGIVLIYNQVGLLLLVPVII